MLAIDRVAWTNRWSARHPLEKLALAGGLLALALVLPPLTGGPVVAVTAITAACVGAGIPLGTVARTLAVPVGFLLAGTPMLALGLEFGDGVRISLRPDGLLAAAAVTLRAFAATSALALLILTTPALDLLALARRTGLAPVIGDLILLIYRMIFVILERAAAGRQAQIARLGDIDTRRALRSTGQLVATLLHRSLDRARHLEIGLAARGYHGDLRLLPRDRPLCPRRLAWVGATLATVAALALALAAAIPGGGR